MPDHFAHPFHLAAQPDGSLRAAVVEQDTEADILACVARIVSFPVGARDDLPEFGVTPLAFQRGDLQTGTLRGQIERWEPRADIDAQETIDAVNATLRTVHVGVRGGTA